MLTATVCIDFDLTWEHYLFGTVASARNLDSRKKDIFLRIAVSAMSMLDRMAFRRYCVSLFFNFPIVMAVTYRPYVVAAAGTKICKLNFEFFFGIKLICVRKFDSIKCWGEKTYHFKSVLNAATASPDNAKPFIR